MGATGGKRERAGIGLLRPSVDAVAYAADTRQAIGSRQRHLILVERRGSDRSRLVQSDRGRFGGLQRVELSVA